MADTSSNPTKPVGNKGGDAGKGGKILGMPRTTGLIVLGIGAVVIGYFVISKFSSQKSTGQGSNKGSSGSSGGGGGWWGGGQSQFAHTVRNHQGHHHHHKPSKVPPNQ